MKKFKHFKEYIQGFIEVVFSENTTYRYSIKDIELKVKNDKYVNIIKYILIGSRTLQKDSAENLLERNAFKKFNDTDSEILSTIHTATTLLNCSSKDEMLNKIKIYINHIQETKN